MKVDGKEATFRRQGLCTIIAWEGGIAIKQHESSDDAAAIADEVDVKTLVAAGFIFSPLAVT